MWVFIVAGILAFAGNAADASCPVVMKPSAVVVKYEGDFTVNCLSLDKTTEGMCWESSYGVTEFMEHAANVTLQIKSVIDWTLSLTCYLKPANSSHCSLKLPVTVYKTIDSVSISMSQSSPMVEGNIYTARCDITSVAPARNLTVSWHKGNKLLQAQPILESNPRPVNKSMIMNVTVDRNDDGAQIWCEAKLTFPQVGLYLPAVKSGSRILSVEYPPTFTHPENETVEVAAHSKLRLNCAAEGKPPPEYTWQNLQTGQNLNGNGSTLAPSFHLPGTYSCTASNVHGTRTKYFTIKETAGNHPMILVTVVVVLVLLGIRLAACIVYQRGRYKPMPSVLATRRIQLWAFHLQCICKAGRNTSGPVDTEKRCSFNCARCRRPRSAATAPLSPVEQVEAPIEAWLRLVFTFVYLCDNDHTERRRTQQRHRGRKTTLGRLWTFTASFNCCCSRNGEVAMWLFMVAGLLACAGNAATSCPLVMKPSAVVVEYEGDFTVDCLSLDKTIEGMGWESSAGGTDLLQNVDNVTLQIKSVVDWTLAPKCYTNLADGSQCLVELPVTVYKMMDSVSFSMSQSSPMVEGNIYTARCDITNVAPARNLTVSWHKGNKLLQAQPILESNPRPVNKSMIMNVTVDRNDDGAQIWCEAKLTFPQVGLYLPALKSGSRILSVEYPPTFTHPENETVEVAAHSKLRLNCAAEGKPPPEYTWQNLQTGQNLNGNGSTLAPSFHLPGTYSCTASNVHGTRTKYFTIKETAGNPTTLVAIVVVAGLLGLALLAAGPFIVTPSGTFSLSKGGYQPTASGPLSWEFPARYCVTSFQLGGGGGSTGCNGGDGGRLLCVSASGEGCSLILKPSRVVVAFGEPVSVSCEAARPVRVLGWESAISAAHTQQELSVQWKVDSLIDWIEEPICYGVFFTAPRQCEEKLNLVLYKTPDSISIRPVNHTGPMVEGKEYQLLCEVQNIAPVQYLTLRWYRGQAEVYKHSFSDLTSSSPVQVSSTLIVTPTKAENGAQYRCIAELDLGPEGPQPLPTLASEPLNASVYFPPMFLSPEPEVLDLVAGAEITLNCTATGNPTPVYSWLSSHPVQERIEDEAVLTSSTLLPGTYTCVASNKLEKKSKQFIVKAKSKGF
ncbi:uncharacterized protein si:ch211-66e2.5 [Betta splendens]|uniref:Uncharacterized protein si:ch211-66e2.5 n=1 Tax=Betta splendens TaxID=158456 RepID=A0A9W2XZ57_BETSP|nr:uncharacterized protein si:ch211-66e2.5 [Betta splendens]